MEEKIIIKSKHYNLKVYQKVLVGVPLGMLLLGLILYLFNFDRSRGPNYWGEYWSIIDNMFDPFSFFPGLLIDLGLIFLIVFVIVAWCISSYELTVTDKRIYGNTSFGKRVDLPVDSISAVATNIFKGISVATSSGKIVFNLIKNRDEVHTAISKLIIDRQKKNTAVVREVIQQESNNSAEELKKYKELLDMGVITQQEFDVKKKQLLGL